LAVAFWRLMMLQIALAIATLAYHNYIVLNYDLHKLGWHSFQQLCLTIAREVLGQTVQSFLDSRDGGRDGAFAGTWKRQKGESLKGRFVIQCKFTSKPMKLSDVADEIEKVRKLVKQKRCDCYLLLTNFDTSGVSDTEIERAFLAVGLKEFRCFGSDWINQQIRDHKRLRMLVPRVYGLGDLSEILDERAYSQALALLESMREDLSKVVLTGVYGRAVGALDEHGFVLLLGEPAAGKTTIASMLAMAAIDQWGVSTLKLETSEQMIERWNPEHPHQFFWIDDAFGVTQFELPLALDWNRIFPKVKAMINAGARVVLTSRDYIYNRAKRSLKESAFPLMRESQVVIDVKEVTPEERRQILYNHIKLGAQPRVFRTAIKPYLERVASHPRFIPETARRLGSPIFTRNLDISLTGLTEFVGTQEQLLEEVIEGLDKHSQAALALIFMRNGSVESPIKLRESEQSALIRLGTDLGEAITALNAMLNSLTVQIREGGRTIWMFKHPTIGDAYASIVLQTSELMDIYLQGASVEKLLSTITCGDLGLEGAVVVPESLYAMVEGKVSAFDETGDLDWQQRWEKRRNVDRFLGERCDRAFLELYLEHHPQLLERVSNPGLRLDTVSEVDVAVRLFKLDLLPEQYRAKFVQTVVEYAVNGEDGHVFESSEIRQMFKRQEKKELKRRIREELIPNLANARHNWEYNLPSDEDPESYIQPYSDLLTALEHEFPGNPEVRKAVISETLTIRRWIEKAQQDMAERGDPRDQEPEYDSSDYSATGPSGEGASRSIFDDIDA
jgi:energy-coupling factor transporter ATP-binding protein EcfA2